MSIFLKITSLSTWKILLFKYPCKRDIGLHIYIYTYIYIYIYILDVTVSTNKMSGSISNVIYKFVYTD